MLAMGTTDYTNFTLLVRNQTNNDFTCSNNGGCLSPKGTNCSLYVSMLSDIVITIDYTQYPIPPSGYMENANDKCQILVSEGPTGFWVLGDTFIRNYYATFNYTGFTVTLAPTAFPQVIQPLVPTPTPTPTPSQTTTLSTTAIVLISAGSVLVAIMVGVLIAFCLKKGCFKPRTNSLTEQMYEN